MLNVSSNRSSIYVELLVEAICYHIGHYCVSVAIKAQNQHLVNIFFCDSPHQRAIYNLDQALSFVLLYVNTPHQNTLLLCSTNNCPSPKWCQLTSMKKRSSHFWNPFKGLPFQLIATLDRNEKLGEKFCIKRWTSTNPSSNSIKPVFCSLLTIPRLFYEEKVWWGQIWELF